MGDNLTLFSTAGWMRAVKKQSRALRIGESWPRAGSDLDLAWPRAPGQVGVVQLSAALPPGAQPGGPTQLHPSLAAVLGIWLGAPSTAPSCRAGLGPPRVSLQPRGPSRSTPTALPAWSGEADLLWGPVGLSRGPSPRSVPSASPPL